MAGREERELSLRFTAAGSEAVSNAIKGLGRSLQTTSSNLDTTKNSARSAGDGFRDFTTKLLLIPTAITSTITLVKGLASSFQSLTFGTINAGIEEIRAAQAFEAVTKSMGGAESVLAKLREATRGFVQDTELQRTVVQANIRGLQLSSDEFARLFGAIQTVSIATGQDFIPLINQVTGALARGRISSLAATIGIDLFSSKELEAIGASEGFGNSIEGVEKKQIALNLIMEKADELFKRLGGSIETPADAAIRAQTQIGNLVGDIQAAVASSNAVTNSLKGFEESVTALIPGSASLGDAVGGVVAGLLDLGTEGLKFAKEAGPAIVDTIKLIGGVIQNLLPTVRDLLIVFKELTGFRATAGIEEAEATLAERRSGVEAQRARVRALVAGGRISAESPLARAVGTPINVNQNITVKSDPDEIKKGLEASAGPIIRRVKEEEVKRQSIFEAEKDRLATELLTE